MTYIKSPHDRNLTTFLFHGRGARVAFQSPVRRCYTSRRAVPARDAWRDSSLCWRSRLQTSCRRLLPRWDFRRIYLSSALAFDVVKYLGAAYLIYLGIRKLLASDNGAEDDEVKQESLARIYWQGSAVNILKPQDRAVFLAFLPQFVDPAKGNVVMQNLLLGAIFVGMAIITDSMYALLASSLAGKLTGNKRFQKGQRYFAGLVYIGLGITTALTGSRK